MARSRPIVVEFTANVRDFLRKTKDVERSTEDIADELEKAEDAAGDFEDSFTRAMKDAERQAERSGRDVEDSFDGVSASFGEVGRESSSEFTSNLSEGLSSGNLEDVLQDTVGGLVGSLSGPLGGIVTAAAAAAAIGLQKIKEAAEEVQEAVDGVREYTINAFDEVEQAARGVEETYEDSGEWLQNNASLLLDNKELLDQAGISAWDLADAVLNGGEAQDEVKRKLDKYIEGRSAIDLLLSGETAQLETITSLIGESERARERTAAEQELVNEATREGRDAMGLITKEAERLQERIENVRRSILNLPDAEIQGRITWYNVGEGAKYLDRSNANYSPGHVSVYNNIYK